MKLGVPMGGNPVSAGVVPGSQASGKVVNRKVRIEVSQTAVSVLTNRNYIQRLLGRMRYHMMPKSNIPTSNCREQYRNSRCSRHRHKDIHLTEGYLCNHEWLCREVSRGHSSQQDMSRYQKDKVGVLTG
jgi:hypothetical protein